jgi:hypothetical protein
LLKVEDTKWLDNASPYALFKALSAVRTRYLGQDAFVYRIRNGKSWVSNNKASNTAINTANYDYLVQYMKNRFDLSGKKIFLPDNVAYALPTSEKMYIGNVPTGTKIFGDRLAVGVYWRNEWGANDIDLSGLNTDGKVGWDGSYDMRGVSRVSGLTYSGDITSAPNGAVEYLYANSRFNKKTLVKANIFNGKEDCGYKIIIGKGDDVTKKHMMDPNNLILDLKTESIQKDNILGIFMPDLNGNEKTQSFTLLNFGSGNVRVSSNSEIADTALRALMQQWSNPIDFRWFVEVAGAEIVKTQDEADYNLSLEHLERDSFMKVFEVKQEEVKKKVA